MYFVAEYLVSYILKQHAYDLIGCICECIGSVVILLLFLIY